MVVPWGGRRYVRKNASEWALRAVGRAYECENLSKKRKTFQKKKNVTSGTKIYPILKEIVWKFCYIAGTVLGRDINIFAGHSVLVYLTLNIYEP